MERFFTPARIPVRTARGRRQSTYSCTGTGRRDRTFPGVDGVTDINIADGPASWEPNDKVLMMASPGYRQSAFRLFRMGRAALTQVPGPPNAAIDGSYYGNMLLLPTGQILLTDFSDDIELYTQPSRQGSRAERRYRTGDFLRTPSADPRRFLSNLRDPASTASLRALPSAMMCRPRPTSPWCGSPI